MSRVTKGTQGFKAPSLPLNSSEATSAKRLHAHSILPPVLARTSFDKKLSSNQLYKIPKYILLGVIILAIFLAILLAINGITIGNVVSSLEHFVNKSGPLGVLAFIASYAAAAVLFLPASLFTLAAGYLFGLPAGVIIVSVAATAGATLAFLISRYLARPYLESQLRGNVKFAKIDAGIASKGARVVLLLRLSPLFPYSLLNYSLGLTRVELLPYAGASWVGMLPGTIAYVYLGTLSKEAAKEASSGIFSPVKLVLYALGAVATIWVTTIISGIASRALEDAQNSSSDEDVA
ncbi:hypothetical protein WJX84_011428 [Apatococcus fuscideae]|uniref:VTT domain-containing protein n=1 Tax=Apatococcus fuscideae TaxID=2026836 RepID=A0AAW1T074_9CHLO